MNITFKETGLADELLQAVEDLGFENPTPIQEKIIPAILTTSGDLIAQAQTGTGKTAAFGLPLIQQTDFNQKYIQTLVLCPTRELCIQITGDMKRYARFAGKFEVVPVYGGESIKNQIDALQKGCHAVVGTPGRVLDLITRNKLDISHIHNLVLDEADEMLSMGFKEELDAILAASTDEKRTLLFSATMPDDIKSIARTYMHDPFHISVSKPNTSTEYVNHEFYVVNAKDRYLALKRVVDIYPKIYGIVFCRTRQETKEVAEKLIHDGYNADALHGDLSQAQRDHVMNRFRIRNLQLLVATDVAARGLDVDHLTHIINYNLPDELEVYIHRSGRTGRAGRSGISVSIIHSRQIGKIKDLERITSKKFVKKPVPNGIEVCEKQLFNLIDKMENIEVEEEQISRFMPVIFKKLSWMSREELIKQFVSVEFNRFLAYYKDAPDLNKIESHEAEGKRRREKEWDRQPESGRERDRTDRAGRSKGIKGTDKSERGRKAERGFTRFFINLGARQNLNAPRLIGLINESTRTRNIEIGKIEILNNFSFFEVDSEFAGKVESSLKNASFDDNPVNVEQAIPDDKKARMGKTYNSPNPERDKKEGGKKKKKRS